MSFLLRPPGPVFRLPVLGLCLAMLGACSSLFPGADRPPPVLYDLTPKSTFEDDLPEVDTQLVIEVPQASAGLTTSRIAIKTHPTRLNYYENAEWSDVATNLVQTLLVESFENTGRIVSVSREGSGVLANYRLIVDLREFQAQLYGDDPTPGVRVRISVRLMRMPERAIIAGASRERVVEAASRELDDVVIAFDDALGKVLKRIVEWTVQTMHEDMRHVGSRRRQQSLLTPSAGR